MDSHREGHPMIFIRKSSDRGLTKMAWLTSYHTFSFANYYDPDFMGFSHLRVINEDYIQPAQGFGFHPHEDMEIITYVVAGELAHKDSMGNGSIIKPGEIQRMSAGTGVRHSEFNASQTDPLHLLQIWLLPNKTGLEPSYEQKIIPKINNKLILIGSNKPDANAVTIHQSVNLYVAYLTEKNSIQHHLESSHTAWLQLIKGQIDLNGELLSPGDGAAIFQEDTIDIRSVTEVELLLFDMAPE